MIGVSSTIIRRIAAGVLLLAATAPFTACINTEAETLYEDVEITRKDELPADTVQGS